MNRLVAHLRSHGEKMAVLTDTEQLTYHQLADAVADAASALDGPRRLVLLETRNDIATLVHYLAATAACHVVLAVDARRDHSAILSTYQPGTLEGWGIGWDALSALNPRLVMVRVTGFGQTGPYKNRAGFGTIAEAFSGFAHITGEPSGPPT